MEIKINGKTYEVPDFCPTDAPQKSNMKWHLDQHGAESFLASKKYGRYAPCVLEELQTRGAAVVETVEVPGPPLEPQGTTSEALPGSVPVTPSLEVPGDTLGSSEGIYSPGSGETSPGTETIQGESLHGESQGDAPPVKPDVSPELPPDPSG